MGEARRGGSSSWIGYRPGMITALLAILAAAAPGPQGETPSAPETVPAIRAQDIAGHIRVLASDAFGGRGPGSEGEARAARARVGATGSWEGGKERCAGGENKGEGCDGR